MLRFAEHGQWGSIMIQTPGRCGVESRHALDLRTRPEDFASALGSPQRMGPSTEPV